MIKLFGDSYRHKKIFVTGDLGFKGSWLVLWLNELGAEVIGYSDQYPSTPSLNELLKLNYTKNFANILDYKNLYQALKKAQPDLIFHLAAQPLVKRSYLDPVLTFQTNVLGTVNVLEAARNLSSLKGIINVTTDKCYQNREWSRAYTEKDPLGGFDPYSSSKACSELVTASYRQSFFDDKKVLVATARSGNVIGGGDWAEDRIIPDIIRATLKSQPTLVRNPQANRPWQHVLETISGYLRLGQAMFQDQSITAGAWNFGPSHRQTSVKKLVTDAQKIWPAIQIEIDYSSQPHEAGKLDLNSDKAWRELSWKNVWDYATTVQKTIDWYRQYYEHDRLITSNQLKNYISAAKKLDMNWTKQ